MTIGRTQPVAAFGLMAAAPIVEKTPKWRLNFRSPEATTHRKISLLRSCACAMLMLGAMSPLLSAQVGDCIPGFAQVKVAKSGTGFGTVIPISPTGAQCYPVATVLTLTAVESAGSSFGSWTGCTTVSAKSCVVGPLRVDLLGFGIRWNVTATFVRPDLVVFNVSGSGSGTVTSSPAGINCGADCHEYYNLGTVVTLTPVPAAGYDFTGWEGGTCTGTGPCAPMMNTQRYVEARFFPWPTITVSKRGSGAVVSNPPGINCGVDCSEPFPRGTKLTLAASPATGATFLGWSAPASGPIMDPRASIISSLSPCSGSGILCATTVQGSFTQPAFFSTLAYPLTIIITGKGKVTSNPAGIDCGAACSHAYTDGTTVTLYATADANWRFLGWSGACSGATACKVTLGAASTVTANFVLQP